MAMRRDRNQNGSEHSGMKPHYTWRDTPSFLRTPVGRKHLLRAVVHRSWPLLQRLATMYRRAVLRHTRVVVVTGSLGKTTTARAISAALGAAAADSANYKSSVALSVLRIPPWRRLAVVEAGIDGPGQMIRYARMIKPDVAVMTSIGSEHHRSLGNIESTRHEKMQILAGLSPQGVAVLNGDDPNVRWMERQTKARVVTFGLAEANDVRASDITLDWPKGTRFRLHAFGKTYEVRTRLVGQVMIYPILAAITASLMEGIPFDQILLSLEKLSPTPGRLEPIQLPNGAFILRDDYKSSLETVDEAIDLFSKIPAKRRIVVLGEVSEPPGAQGPIYRNIGERIAKAASRAIFIGGNFQRYSAGARRGGLPSSSLMDAGRSVLKAAEILRSDLDPGDVILIKGRDSERLDRITLSLMGRAVRCNLNYCNTRVEERCERCPMLERGWEE